MKRFFREFLNRDCVNRVIEMIKFTGNLLSGILSSAAVGLLVLVQSQGAVAQIKLHPRKPIDEKIIAAVPDTERAEFYKRLRDEKRREIPRVIFIPGILGSKISECQSDGSQCHLIWGTASSITDATINLAIRDDRVYKTDVVDSVFFQQIYGGILNEIRSEAARHVTDAASDPILTVFSYDWRRSNKISAASLSEIICDIRLRAPDAPISIIAHSMGGLIAKIWMKDHSSKPCSVDGKSPTTKEVVFVGTPHLGAPKAVKALSKGYNILFGELNTLSGLSGIFGYFERKYLLEAINNAGMTFPSLYEILPIQTSDFCRTKKAVLRGFANPMPVVDRRGSEINLYDAQNWMDFDFLRRIEPPALRNTFYKKSLPELLKNAELLSCELVDFDPGSVASVTYIVGHQSSEGTDGWITLARNLSDIIQGIKPTYGDGTVPDYSAANALVSRTLETKRIPLEHTALVNSRFLALKFKQWFEVAAAKAKTKIAAAKKEFLSLVAAEAAATGQLLPMPLDAGQWDTKYSQRAAQINSIALNHMGYSANVVEKLASRARDPSSTASLYALAANIQGISEEKKLSLTAALARAAYLGSDYQSSIASSEFVLAQARSKENQLDSTTMKNVTTRASEARAWAYLRSGDEKKFAAYLKEAEVRGIKLAEPKALNTYFLRRGSIVAVQR